MSSLSTSLYGSSTNKGVGGLLSGLDTDDLVKQMTAATRNKINRQYQSKQKLLYRQEAYREISKKLLTFSDKYFSYSSGSKTNILSPKFFESYTFKSSSNYVNVTGNAENIKNFSIDSITRVASAASFTSKKQVASATFESENITAKTSTLAGATFTIEFDNKNINLTIDKGFGNGSDDVTLQEVVDQLNKQLATIDGNNDNSKLKYKVNELTNQIEFEAGSAKLIAASTVFKENLNMNVGEDAVSSAKVDEANLTKDSATILKNQNSFISFDFNGVTKTINLAEKVMVPNADGTGTEEIELNDVNALKRYLQSELDKAYGKGKVEVSDANNKLTFSAVDGSTNIFGVSSISTELSNFTGIEAGDYNRLSKTKPITELGIVGFDKDKTVELSNGNQGYKININNVDIEIEATMSVTDVINKINSNAEAGVKVYYSSTSNTFTVKATETGAHKGVSIAAGEGTLAQALFGSSGIDYDVKPGTDTEMTYTLNGVKNTIKRSTANFTIDDINIELNEKAAGIATAENPISFDVTNNTDEVVERVKEFINAYNEIINLIGTKTSEKPNRNYLPLTPEQQDEMEEEEIKNWNIEAKKGVLYGDSKMNTVLRSMRESMSGFTDVSSLTLSSIGISSAGMDTSGKLVFDEKKFKEKLLDNPDEIANLFTNTSSNTGKDAKSGIALQLNKILKDNVGTYGTTGLLIEEAGMDNSMTSDKNYISEKMKQYDDKMAELKKDLEAERKRYWNQFSALEQSLNKLNAQSSWLTDSMG